jgi:hypothetical protein
MRLGTLAAWLGGTKQNDGADGVTDTWSSLDTLDGTGAATGWMLWPGSEAPAFAAGDAVLGQAAAAAAPMSTGATAPAPTAAAAVADPVSPAADEAVGGAQATATYGVTGAGIKIGIISDSFNNMGNAAADEADGALPAAGNVDILQDGSGGSDEGRAMAQIAHSIASGASIDFYTAGTNPASMATAVAALQAQGCQIICSDINFSVYGEESMFQQGGAINHAIDAAVGAGVTYFTCATNYGPASAYQGSFTPLTVTLPGVGAVTANDFGSGSPYEAINVTGGYVTSLDLQWNEPWQSIDGTGAAHSLALDVFSKTGSTYQFVGALNTDQVGGDPAQTGALSAAASGTYYLAVVENGGTGFSGQFKIEAENNSFSPVTVAGANSGTLIGNAMDANAIVVGAAPVTNPTVMEDFSSSTVSGPSQYLLNASGAAIAPVDAGVTLTAVDGNAIADDTGVGANFYGTSAATPAAAAVGALVLQANPALDPADVRNLLDDSATVVGSAAASGAGLINADIAVGDALSGTITATAGNGVLYGTHLGDTFIAGPGNHDFIGTGGVNTLDYAGAPGAVTIDFSTGTVAANGYGGGDRFSGIENVITGGAGDVVLLGGGSDPEIALNGGSVNATPGSAGSVTGNNDTMSAAAGAALTISGTGESLTMGGASAVLAGGSTATVTGNGDTISGGSGVGLTLSGTGDAVSLTNSSVTLAGSGETAWLFGSGDTIGAGAGDTLSFTGSDSSLCFGGGTLSVSGSGNRLVAGAGAGTMSGGSGGNTFAFSDASGPDIIADFAASTSNVLDLGGVGAFHAAGLAGVEAHWTQSGGSVVIADPTTSTSLTLQNTTVAYLQAHSGEIHT